MSALMILWYGYMRKTSTFIAHQWAWQPESHHKCSGHGINGKTCGNQELVFSPHAYTSHLCRWRDCGSTKTSPIFVCYCCNPWCVIQNLSKTVARLATISGPFGSGHHLDNSFHAPGKVRCAVNEVIWTRAGLWCCMYPTAYSTQGCAESAMIPLGFSSSVLILCLCCNQPLQDFESLTAEGPSQPPSVMEALSCKGEILCDVWEEIKHRQKDS